MFGHSRPAQHWVHWLRSHAVVCALLVVAAVVADAHLMEILMDAEEPPAAPAPFFDLKAALQSAATGLREASAAAAAVPEAQAAAAAAMGQCRIEYQVMKSVAGWCTRLGRSGTHACVSDGHLVPFHPECSI